MSSQPQPTVLYDTERPSPHSRTSQSSSLLDPPDLPTLLRSKRSWTRTILSLDFPILLKAQRGLTCLSICLSALQANGVYCWGTYGPVVERMLGLNGTETQTIVVGGILGVYLMAAPLGSFTDHHGPRAGSFISALLGGAGYLTFAAILNHATFETPYVHLYLTAAYFLVGAATVGSYFACLTCATLSFPSHPTLSLSLPLSLVGLSALVLSSFSTLSTFHQSTELDPIRFLTFLGIFSPCINLFGSLFMRVLPSNSIALPGHEHESLPIQDGEEEEEEEEEPIDRLLHLDEHTPLLIGGLEAAREEVEAFEKGEEAKWTVKRMLADWEGFWAFGLLLALVTGPGEMIIASIGSILTSLLPRSTALMAVLSSSIFAAVPSTPSFSAAAASATATATDALTLRNKHVYLISLSSTLSRLMTGFLADRLSPPLVAIPNPAHRTDRTAPTHTFVRRRKVLLPRSAFAAICALVLAGVFGWNAGFLGGEGGLWVLSVGVGAMYGALFTLTPAIVSHHFGPTNFGLAWGMVSYFAAVGSVAFSYLYAIISSTIAQQSHSPEHDHIYIAHGSHGSRGSHQTDLTTTNTSSWTTSTSTPINSHLSSARTTDIAIDTCYGPECFRTTFIVCAICCVVGSAGLVLLGRRWKV